MLWQLSAIFDAHLKDKPTTSTALLFLPCLGWKGKGRKEFEIQVMTHFGAFLLGATLNSAVQPGGYGVWLEASSFGYTRFVLDTLVLWLIHCSPEKEPSSGNVGDTLHLLAQCIIENNASIHLLYRYKALDRQRLGSERWHNS